MHFVIMGCGRVGATLAHSLEDQGHGVAVIDQNPEAFRRLGPSFSGMPVTLLLFSIAPDVWDVRLSTRRVQPQPRRVKQPAPPLHPPGRRAA